MRYLTDIRRLKRLINVLDDSVKRRELEILRKRWTQIKGVLAKRSKIYVREDIYMATKRLYIFRDWRKSMYYSLFLDLNFGLEFETRRRLERLETVSRDFCDGRYRV